MPALTSLTLRERVTIRNRLQRRYTMMYKSKMEKWAIIHFGGADALVTLDEEEPGKFYWSGGPSWCTFSEDTYIVKEYGYLDSKSYNEIDALFLDFYKNYNLPEEDIRQSAGWLSPTGKFFPCSYFEHDQFARSLAAIYHDSLGGTKRLEDEGWFRIYDNGHYGRADGVIPTKKQLETIQDILSSPNHDPEYKENLSFWFKCLLEEYEELQ
jgi:hypothetical protein